MVGKFDQRLDFLEKKDMMALMQSSDCQRSTSRSHSASLTRCSTSRSAKRVSILENSRLCDSKKKKLEKARKKRFFSRHSNCSYLFLARSCEV